MSIQMDVAKQIIDEKISEGGIFSLNELEKEILNQGGALEVAPCITIKDYLGHFEKKGILTYNPEDKTYVVLRGILDKN